MTRYHKKYCLLIALCMGIISPMRAEISIEGLLRLGLYSFLLGAAEQIVYTTYKKAKHCLSARKSNPLTPEEAYAQYLKVAQQATMIFQYHAHLLLDHHPEHQQARVKDIMKTLKTKGLA